MSTKKNPLSVDDWKMILENLCKRQWTMEDSLSSFEEKARFVIENMQTSHDATESQIRDVLSQCFYIFSENRALVKIEFSRLVQVFSCTMSMGIRSSPLTPRLWEKCMQVENNHESRIFVKLFLDYGLFPPPGWRQAQMASSIPVERWYHQRLDTRARCIALLSLWKKRCAMARRIGRDALGLIARWIWSQRFD